MTNEEFVRQAYAIAEVRDIPAWVDCFNPDGVFVDESVGVTYRGPDEVAKPVENYGGAFSDMHRELYDVYVSGDVVAVELALQGTHDGPLWLPQGILPPTGNRMDAPCCDVFKLEERADPAVRLLPVGHRDPGPARRAGEPRRGPAAARLRLALAKKGSRYLMTSQAIRDPLADHLITPQNAALRPHRLPARAVRDGQVDGS